MYVKKDITKVFAASPPATEESVHISSNEGKTSGMEDHETATDNIGLDSISGDSLKEEKALIEDKGEWNVQQQEESSPDQNHTPNEQSKNYRENEVSDKDLSASGSEPTSESLEVESKGNNVEISATKNGLSSPPEDVDEQEYDATSSTNVKEEADQDAIDIADSTDEDDVEHVFEEPDVLITGFEEPTEDGNSLVENATSLPEASLEESLLQSVEDLPGATVEPYDFGTSGMEMGIKSRTIQREEWEQGKSNIDYFASPVELNRRFLCASITAPSTPPDSLPEVLGKVVVPAPVDHMQEQVLAALQALKVIEADVKPGDICTRREYARWLMSQSAILKRSPAHKVLPAMYIENTSVLAYTDVGPEDQDFPFIQGLAEAGLLSSRLLGDEKQLASDSNKDFLFAPDSPLTRQDLVTWKIALERKPVVTDESPFPDGVETVQKNFGFIDFDKIHKDAWPALLADVKTGEQSIIALVFGHTRRLQPQKPVSKAQAATALATGEAWELVSEELLRLEAESVAEAAVAAELALETKAQQEVASAFQELLQAEREKRKEAASLVESTRAELEQVKTDRESEKYSLLKERAALDSQKDFLLSARSDVEERALALSSAKQELEFQLNQADKFRVEAEEQKALISKVRSELEIEKNALILARLWAEDEARKAQAHSKALEEVRSRVERQGGQVNVEQELNTANENVGDFSPSWRYSESLQEETSPMDGFIKRSKEWGRMFVEAFMRFVHFMQLVFQVVKERATALISKAGGKFHEARIAYADSDAAKRVENFKERVPSSVAGITTNVRERTLKAVDDWKGGAEKLSEKFKTS